MTKARRLLTALAGSAALTVGAFAVAPPAAAGVGWAMYDCELADGSPYWTQMEVEFQRDGSTRLYVTANGALPMAYPTGAIYATLQFTSQSALSGIHSMTVQSGAFFRVERTSSPVLGSAPYKIAFQLIATPGAVDCYLISGPGSWPTGGV
ncbi:hypothetical protein [Streptodolium elevatio]|uniref:Uncharacterized protein n=1 Tax=Streptodolium elevatio TaxID=3157996 RepID=A0ABV3DTX3_9ACTN